MLRLLSPTILTSAAILALGSAVHAGSPAARSSSTSYVSSSTKVVTYTSLAYKPSYSGQTFISKNTTIIGIKTVTKVPMPLTVKSPGKNSLIVVSTKLYATNYGVKFKRGIYYKGLYHTHWSARYFHPRWRTWCWYCPSTCCWYYWCGVKECYLPVVVITSYPPAEADGETVPPGSEETAAVSGSEAPDVPNPEGIE